MYQANLHIGSVGGNHITADKIIKFMEDNGYSGDVNDVTIMEVDSEGNPIPETAQKLGNIATIELTPEPDTVDIQELEDSTPISVWTEISDADIAAEIEMNKFKNKQLHYDETHSRKSNWHKRYF